MRGLEEELLGGFGCIVDRIVSTLVGTAPVGLKNVTKIPNITFELVRNEYEKEDVSKILGGNQLRLFKRL